MYRSMIVAMLVLAPTFAFADKKAADACAAKLTGDAKVIYDASAPDFPSASDPRAEVKGKVQDLVQSGKINGASAQASAMSAGSCLKKLR